MFRRRTYRSFSKYHINVNVVKRVNSTIPVPIVQFYAEAAEAEQWIREKNPQVTSTDYGKDEDSVQSLLKKLEGIERDLSGFESTIVNLKKLSHGLIERHHFDSKNIGQKQGEIESKFKELQNLKDHRLQRLLESEKFFQFIRQADEAIEWIGDQTTVSFHRIYIII